MGGRYGKYGEIKRFDNLRNSRKEKIKLEKRIKGKGESNYVVLRNLTRFRNAVNDSCRRISLAFKNNIQEK